MHRALIMDSTATMRAVLAALLRESGIEPIEAPSAEEGPAQLRHGRPVDLVLADCMGPEAGGVAWLEAARRAAPLAKPMVVSGETRKSRGAAALATGAEALGRRCGPSGG